MASMRVSLALAAFALLAMLATAHANTDHFPCAWMDAEGTFYNMNNLTYITVGPGYVAFDAGFRYSVNICGLVSEKVCHSNFGYVCMYNATSGAMDSVLATLELTSKLPQWTPLTVLGHETGMSLIARNGFHEAGQAALVTIEMTCKPDAPHSNTLQLEADYARSVFTFRMQTPWSCPYGKAAFSVHAPEPLSRSGLSTIVVGVNTLPPADVTLACTSPYLLISPMQVTFRGPVDGEANYFEAHVKLVDSVPMNVKAINLTCSVSGSNATLYSHPSTVTVLVSDHPAPHGHKQLSAGSVFLIIFFVTSFCYLFFGVLYNWRIKGMEVGAGLFPHADFWSNIWQLAMDGNAYFFGQLLGISACRRSSSRSHTAASSRTYQEVH